MEAFERKKDKVAIVGFAPATRALAPFDDPEYEIWGLNEEYSPIPHKVEGVMQYATWMKRYDRWFQIHPRYDFMREDNNNDRNHPLWLKNKTDRCMACGGTTEWTNIFEGGKKEKCPFCKGGIYTPLPGREGLIIYMQEEFPDIPGSVKYPLKEIVDTLMSDSMKKTKRGKYFVSSPAFMLALAIHMGYKTIGLYGFEMGSETEYHYQKSNFEYWIGKAEGLGIEIDVPEQSPLLRGVLYGYTNLKTGYRQDLELRKMFLEGRTKISQVEMHIAEGVVKGIKSIKDAGVITAEKLDELYKAAQLEHSKAQSMVNFKRGAHQETIMQIKMFDAYFNAEINDTDVNLTETINTDYVF